MGEEERGERWKGEG